MSNSVKVTVLKGTNLVVKDWRSSDPYVLLKLDNNRVVSTRVIKKNLNPVWNQVFQFPLTETSPCLLKLEVWDKDKIFKIDWLDPDDYMGDAEIDLKPLVKRDDLKKNGTKVLVASKENCLFKDSCIMQREDGKRVQDVCLKLRNADSGLLDLQLEWPV